jgi:hypothetical protein
MTSVFEYPTNITGINELVLFANNLTNGFLGIGILLSTFIITFAISSVSGSIERPLGISSFLTFLASLILYAMGIIQQGTLTTVLILFCFSVAYIWFSSSRNNY